MRSPVRASVFASVGVLSNVKAAKTTSKLPGANSPAMLVTNKVVLSRRVDRACLIQHCLRDICADDVKSEISNESSRSAGAAAEVERPRAVVIAANQGRQIAKREIVRSRKFKRRIRASPFLIFVHVAECVIHAELSVRLTRTSQDYSLGLHGLSFGDIDQRENHRPAVEVMSRAARNRNAGIV